MNPFVQPLLRQLCWPARSVAVVVHFQPFSTVQRLVAVCPCMVLPVPGPHLPNGDRPRLRAHRVLGAARILYAGLIIVIDLHRAVLSGLALGGVTLPVSGPSVPATAAV